MTERPILFSGPMVRAILAGTKTQTRRLVKPRAPGGYRGDLLGQPWIYAVDELGTADPEHPIRCPYGVPGDPLWVRETWGYRGGHWSSDARSVERHTIEYQADGAKREFVRASGDRSGLPAQRCRCVPAGGKRTQDDVEWDHQRELTRYWAAWRPSIHLPRWASRLTLEVTDVRVQRLHDITWDDCIAEGMDPRTAPDGGNVVDAFKALWDSINAKRAPWDRNPFVWAVTFRRCA